VVLKPYESGTYYEGLWKDACRIGLPLSEFELHDPAELGEVFSGYNWRTRREAILVAYFTAAFTVGTKELPDLADLLSDEPPPEQSPAEYHKRLKELGLE
jgi:hypothetical protein